MRPFGGRMAYDPAEATDPPASLKQSLTARPWVELTTYTIIFEADTRADAD